MVRVLFIVERLKMYLGHYDSVIAKGTKGPDMQQEVVLMNGAKIPNGTHTDYEYWTYEHGKRKDIRPSYQNSEYVVFDVSQVRMRYLVQV